MWKELASRLCLGKTIDSELQRIMAAEKAHWRSVLTRIIDCILFLAERNLPLRGKNAQLGNPKNGNFLGILELIARYDVTLAEHLRKAASKKMTGYLSWCTQNEFLDSISECVLGKISAQIKASKYFAVELDCTPDISKQEQASVIIRYIDTDEKKNVTITESFVGFTAVKDTTGKGLTHTLIGVLENLGLDLANCRGQSYDNGSNMRGINKGVQALIQQRCPEALFIPCCSHSLNLLLCDAASSNRECLTFFGTLQRLYTIFSSSVKRWDILTEFVDITLKPLSDTRWEAKLDSVKAVRFQLGGILDALQKLEEVAGDSKIVSEAKSLSDEIVSMEFLVCKVDL
ncbi:zinc finger MYM-type protein 1 [Austrofundulus limnaeus]|uniref:Zinc finger MYM-type protein 1 n=1 Tax=Austrofundulus limnaeus TaxID=52670 RepID=A0A2I4AHL5_AUSLI|nr:PREDICTED: zinc finger MYM-type protein 1-like [Austrofundulus limnaeus]